MTIRSLTLSEVCMRYENKHNCFCFVPQSFKKAAGMRIPPVRKVYHMRGQWLSDSEEGLLWNTLVSTQHQPPKTSKWYLTIGRLKLAGSCWCCVSNYCDSINDTGWLSHWRIRNNKNWEREELCYQVTYFTVFVSARSARYYAIELWVCVCVRSCVKHSGRLIIFFFFELNLLQNLNGS
jgi:hypothetical protein